MIADIVKDELKPKVVSIDHGHYTTDILAKLGQAGAFKPHIASMNGGETDLFGAISAMADVSRECMTTGFMMWAHDVCCWYIENSDNAWLKTEILPKMVAGEVYGATALSNPMKYFSGIEDLKLSAVETDEGYIINGTLPWVSNLLDNSDQHFFGSIFTVKSEVGQKDVMALVPCNLPGLTMKQMVSFAGMEGSGTYALIFDNAFLPKRYLLADPIKPYLTKIKAGFILLQTGMALGVIQGCIDEMHKADLTLAEINAYLDDRPDELQEELDDVKAMIAEIAATPFDSSVDYLRQVLEARLLGSEFAKRAADAVMQHCGAKGYILDAPAQRKQREAYFVIIVTPSIKHLRKELARLDAA